MSTPDQTEQPGLPTAKKKTTGSATVSLPQGTAAKVDESFSQYLSDTDRVGHDLNIAHVTAERFRSSEEFIRACTKVGVWRLKQGNLTDDAGFYIGELARELAQTVLALVERGDVMLARRLPPVVEILQGALKAYGSKITGRVTKRLSIGQILKKYKARELLAMLSALHPDWEIFLNIYHPKLQNLPEDERRDILLRKRRKIESFPEEKLRRLLLSNECWTNYDARTSAYTEERRTYGISEIIESIVAIREGENENINLFVELLWQGRLWGLAPEKSKPNTGKTFADCPWKGRKDLPARDNVRAWMKIVMPFLREVTGGHAMRLHVFKYMLAARRSVFAGERLADDKPEYIWNQIENRIGKAWVTMARRARKRNSRKGA